MSAEATDVRERLKLAQSFVDGATNLEKCVAAEAICRTALETLDSTGNPLIALEAYVILAEAMSRPLPHLPRTAAREARISGALGILHAAEYIAAGQDVPVLRARIDELSSRALAERFHGDRDSNLLEAIRAGKRALPELRRALGRAPTAYPALQVHLGNCYLNLDGPRSRWLQHALAAYEDGLTVLDAQQAHALHAVLSNNKRMTEALITSGDTSLPPKEMLLRFGASADAAVARGDTQAAIATAWAAMAWAWSVAPAPSDCVAEGHTLFGQTLVQLGEARHARDHFYCAIAVLTPIAGPGTHLQAIIEGARSFLQQTMTDLGEPADAEAFIRQAAVAFSTARQHCARGADLIETSAESALDAFQEALALFPHDPHALFYRGAALMKLGRLEAARDDFDSVLRYQPKNVRALATRAAIRNDMRDTDGALADYARVLEIDPRNVAALYSRAVIRALACDFRSALEDLDVLTAAHPEMAQARALRAECVKRAAEQTPGA
jgi:tetratricopeptide (TPR) repeat protein